MRMEIPVRLSVFESDEITVFHENNGIVAVWLLVPSFDDPVIILILMGIRCHLLLSCAYT